MTEPAMSQLSDDEILAVQEIRKRKEQERAEKEAQASRKFSPETLRIVDRVCEILKKMDREAEAANKQNERTTTSQEKEVQAGRKYSPETLAKVDRFCEILQKMDREAEQRRDAANKPQATSLGSYSANF